MASPAPRRIWRARNHRIPVGERTLVMGIVNVTPDSFSDGGKFDTAEAAVAHGERLVAEGADILDVGGESTRPGASPVDPHEEARRVVPVVEALAARTRVPISVDTRRGAVARQALDAGASIVNDITALRGDPQLVEAVKDARAGIVLMHMQGDPRTMQKDPQYDDVVAEVRGFLARRARWAEARAVPRDAIALDPGIGFGKTLEHNLELLRHVGDLASLGYPVLVGHSRKSFLGAITGSPVTERVPETIAAGVLAVAHGADVIRVHDVAENVRGLRVADAFVRGTHRG